MFSFREAERRGIEILSSGGNDWSHDADRIKEMDEYVHLAFVDDHPMLFWAKKEHRISEPVWLKIDSSILLGDDVRFSSDVSNKTGVAILQCRGSKKADRL